MINHKLAVCKVENCNKVTLYGNIKLCSKHYTRMKKYGSYELPKPKSKILLETGFVHCYYCNIEKDMSLFHNDCTTTTGKSKICIACTKLKDAIWHEKNKERNRANKYRRIYGITIEDYEKLYKEQNNGCAICGVATDLKRRLSVDHDHITGKVRGLLCSNCNKAIGYLKDNISHLKNAIQYLEKYQDS